MDRAWQVTTANLAELLNMELREPVDLVFTPGLAAKVRCHAKGAGAEAVWIVRQSAPVPSTGVCHCAA